MNVRDLMPWTRNGSHQALSLFHEDERSPFYSLHRDMNRLFDDFFRTLDTRLPSFTPLSSASPGWPSVEIAETEQEIKVTVEVPGLDEKDLEILLDNGVLTLKGEKRSETADKDKQFSERFYGRFERRIPLGLEVEEDKIEASFKNGVLSVVLPKSAKAQSQVKRIAIKH